MSGVGPDLPSLATPPNALKRPPPSATRHPPSASRAISGTRRPAKSPKWSITYRRSADSIVCSPPACPNRRRKKPGTCPMASRRAPASTNLSRPRRPTAHSLISCRFAAIQTPPPLLPPHQCITYRRPLLALATVSIRVWTHRRRPQMQTLLVQSRRCPPPASGSFWEDKGPSKRRQLYTLNHDVGIPSRPSLQD